MINDIISNIWPDWEIVKQIGRGSYGTVYEAVRRSNQVESHAAIKVISIPQNESEVESLRADGLSEDATHTYMQNVVNDFVSEIQLMESFKGIQNIVSVEDYKVIEKEDGIGWDIYIRMELLTPFNTFSRNRVLTEQEVIKLGCDICTALEICSKTNVIHRDIKPENIFVNSFGDFKIGDFGIARKLENVTGGLSQKGTYNYMAPEIERGTQYDASVDLYSLGLVMYRLLNDNRLPFIENEQQLMNPNERMNAVKRRMNGEPIPNPCNASPSVSEIIHIACAYEPEKRFKSPTAMKTALSNLLNGNTTLNKTVSANKPLADPDKTTSVRKPNQIDSNKTTSVNKPTQMNSDQTMALKKQQNPENRPKKVDTFGEKKKSKAPKILVAFVVVAIATGAGVFAAPKLMDMFDGNDNKDSSKESVQAESSDDNNSEIETEYDNTEISEIISVAEKYADSTKYEEALAQIKKGLAKYPDSEKLKEKENEYIEALSDFKADMLTQAETYANSENYKAAIDTVKKAQEKYGDDSECQKALASYTASYKKSMIAEADNYSADGDFLAAIKKIREAEDVVSDDVELEGKLKSLEDTYVSVLVVTADEYISDLEFDEAIKVIKGGLNDVPNNKELSAKLEEIENKKPVPLSSLDIFNGNWDWEWNQGAPVDPFGNDYSTSCNYYINFRGNITESFSEYHTDGKFEKLTFKLAPYKEIGQNGESYIQVFADEKLMYTSPVITRKTEAFNCEVDISGAKYIEIKAFRTYSFSSSSEVGMLIFANAQLWPEK